MTLSYVPKEVGVRPFSECFWRFSQNFYAEVLPIPMPKCSISRFLQLCDYS